MQDQARRGQHDQLTGRRHVDEFQAGELEVNVIGIGRQGRDCLFQKVDGTHIRLADQSQSRTAVKLADGEPRRRVRQADRMIKGDGHGQAPLFSVRAPREAEASAEDRG